MKLTNNRELNAIIHTWRLRGANVTVGRHIKIRFPNGRMVVVSVSPSDHRALMNIKADIRRATAS